MTQQQTHFATSRHPTPPQRRPRLRLKPKAAQAGHVDGAWWPWSGTLTTELPGLLSVLSVRVGSIQRVRYNLSEWAPAPSKLTTDGRTVRLDGYERQPVNTLEVLGADRSRILLLVVPPRTKPDQAHETMMSAAAPNNDSNVDALLVISDRERESRTARAHAEHRWVSKAGDLS
ncbi:DUF5994 family protein [[Mycobacterium] holstebronense]|uniref:DUF5994 family protein n=1 Tax=[Mycobacterium] holstebronense TaxID=3064288 RepID=A0ABN9NUV5_9MYCO|nr:DUF5994 family protein [Mycolicibacter sp. MU0102]CAJ1510107.1 DUF5994 family protein [Mycolicibacter sp. MU0102]